jgi:hypothetical protein
MQVFDIAPSDSKALLIVGGLAIVVVVLVVGLLGMSVLGSRSSRFEVSDRGLRLRGDLYGRLIPPAAIRSDSARRVNFSHNPELAPTRRTMGTALPGYQSGWFRLRNGEKALLYLTDRTRAVYVPTSEGYSVLLSPIDPDGFLQALKAVRR